MSEEDKGGNTPPDQGGDNTPEGDAPKETPDQNPLFPKAAGDVPTGEDPKEEPEVDPRIKEIQSDPVFQKFAEESGSVEIAFKRWQDSSKEAKKLADEREQLATYQQGYEAVRRDFDIMRQVNPELYKQVVELFQGLETGKVSPEGEPSTPEPKQDDTMSEEKMQKIAELQTTLSEFQRDYKEVIGDEDDLKRIRKFAASMAGASDREGNPFTYKQALLAGLQYYHPEVLTDQAKMEAMADIEQRSSASEPGNSPSGSAPKSSDTPLTKEEKRVATQFGMTEAEYRKYQKQ